MPYPNIAHRLHPDPMLVTPGGQTGVGAYRRAGGRAGGQADHRRRRAGVRVGERMSARANGCAGKETDGCADEPAGGQSDELSDCL